MKLNLNHWNIFCFFRFFEVNGLCITCCTQEAAILASQKLHCSLRSHWNFTPRTEKNPYLALILVKIFFFFSFTMKCWCHCQTQAWTGFWGLNFRLKKFLLLPTYSTYCVFRSTYVATMSFESNLGFFFQRTYIKGIEEIRKKNQNTFSSASQFPPLDCGFYIIKQVIVANFQTPACCFWKMDDWRKFPNDVRKSACVTQSAQTKYFTGHSFFITPLLSLTRFLFLRLLANTFTQQRTFAKLKYLSTYLWSMSLVEGLNENEEQLSFMPSTSLK